jgi:hypothetical protein
MVGVLVVGNLDVPEPKRVEPRETPLGKSIALIREDARLSLIDDSLE